MVKLSSDKEAYSAPVTQKVTKAATSLGPNCWHGSPVGLHQYLPLPVPGWDLEREVPFTYCFLAVFGERRTPNLISVISFVLSKTNYYPILSPSALKSNLFKRIFQDTL